MSSDAIPRPKDESDRRAEQRGRRTFFLGVAVFCLVVFAGPCCLFHTEFYSIPDVQDWWNRRPFDEPAWKSEAVIKSGGRYFMVDDLLRRHDFHGMSESEVRDLLGEPERLEPFRYYLGKARHSIGPDSAYLSFLFVANRVSEVWIGRR